MIHTQSPNHNSISTDISDRLLVIVQAYLEFSKIRRPQIVAGDSNMTFQDVGRKLGKEWRNMKEGVKKRFQVR